MARLLFTHFSLLFLPVLLSGQDLLISEFMADPTPSRGLPRTEYIELFNPGPIPIALESIAIASGGRAASAGKNDVLQPDSFLVLVPSDSLAAWRQLGIPVAGMDLPGLTNSGDVITLMVEGDTLAEIRYTEKWYRDDNRDNGGYSLEYNGLDDPLCPGSWTATRSDSGGTPGKTNSVNGLVLDADPPKIVRVDIAEDGFTLVFDDALHDFSRLLVEINGESVQAERSAEGYQFAIRLEEGRVYELAVLPGYRDCSGNMAMDTFTTQLLRPGTPRPRDLLINEVLFDPVPGGGDYVEILNNSLLAIQLQGISVDNTFAVGAPKPVVASYILRPGQLAVLTADTNHVRQFFPRASVSAIIETNLPSLPNERGNITLLAEDGTVLDAFDYTGDLHDELLNPTEGVSLERLAADRPTQERDNWYSAASTVGYGTPTLPNSQQVGEDGKGSASFYLVSDSFDPRGGILPDRLELGYRAGRPGLQATVRVFDAAGHLIRTMTRVALLARSGSLFWDGKDEAGRLQPVGAYVLLIETFSPDGDRFQNKLVGILAG
ncbi:lamin tail domain-containing protein [Lewinella sp. IMCC34191]|uniref:lamin tail domain-containing protein n=1 Tax=Lewinella sp. IMCC34191 TaxID=2259172 RepID=UPI000E230BC3|nr:hypothetical protein [Lewinella sp. IMCC34191]